MKKLEYKLVTDQGQEEAIIGNKYKDFKGEVWELDGWRAPTHAGSTGRVYVHTPGKDKITSGREFFPGVLNMKIIEQEED